MALASYQVCFHIKHSSVINKTWPVTHQSLRRNSHNGDTRYITRTIQYTNKISHMVQLRSWQNQLLIKYSLINTTAKWMFINFSVFTIKLWKKYNINLAHLNVPSHLLYFFFYNNQIKHKMCMHTMCGLYNRV